MAAACIGRAGFHDCEGRLQRRCLVAGAMSLDHWCKVRTCYGLPGPRNGQRPQTNTSSVDKPWTVKTVGSVRQPHGIGDGEEEVAWLETEATCTPEALPAWTEPVMHDAHTTVGCSRGVQSAWWKRCKVAQTIHIRNDHVQMRRRRRLGQAIARARVAPYW